MRYRCAEAAESAYFFTVNLAERRSDLLVRHIDDLRAAMKAVKCWVSFHSTQLTGLYIRLRNILYPDINNNTVHSKIFPIG
ncbi:MAG: hypothetical protein DID92_2727743803 [Candidatus Nitrotoga sp. SPKER]|nr:MAG: hypothetical protein DID92_2727743803 [Candidatus Nitrotoga sp. SPKER]